MLGFAWRNESITLAVVSTALCVLLGIAKLRAVTPAQAPLLSKTPRAAYASSRTLPHLLCMPVILDLEQSHFLGCFLSPALY